MNETSFYRKVNSFKVNRFYLAAFNSPYADLRREFSLARKKNAEILMDFKFFDEAQ